MSEYEQWPGAVDVLVCLTCRALVPSYYEAKHSEWHDPQPDDFDTHLALHRRFADENCVYCHQKVSTLVGLSQRSTEPCAMCGFWPCSCQ